MAAYVFTPMCLADFAYGLEAVAIRPLGDRRKPLNITNAKRSVLSSREAATSEGRYITGDIAWNMPADEVGDVDPAPGSHIVDVDDVLYTVQSVERINYNTRVRFVSRALSILAGLDTVVTIQTVTYAKGNSQASEPTWATYQANVRAKITELSRDVVFENNMQIDRKHYEIEFEEGVTVPGKDYRVLDRSSVAYPIIDFSPGTIGSLPLAHCLGDPWPHS